MNSRVSLPARELPISEIAVRPTKKLEAVVIHTPVEDEPLIFRGPFLFYVLSECALFAVALVAAAFFQIFLVRS